MANCILRRRPIYLGGGDSGGSGSGGTTTYTLTITGGDIEFDFCTLPGLNNSPIASGTISNIPAGQALSVKVNQDDTSGKYKSIIAVNGTTVKSGMGAMDYQLTINSNVSVRFEEGEAYITT